MFVGERYAIRLQKLEQSISRLHASFLESENGNIQKRCYRKFLVREQRPAAHLLVAHRKKSRNAVPQSAPLRSDKQFALEIHKKEIFRFAQLFENILPDPTQGLFSDCDVGIESKLLQPGPDCIRNMNFIRFLRLATANKNARAGWSISDYIIPFANSSRMPPSQLRASAQSRALACDLRGSRRQASTSTADPAAGSLPTGRCDQLRRRRRARRSRRRSTARMFARRRCPLDEGSSRWTSPAPPEHGRQQRLGRLQESHVPFGRTTVMRRLLDRTGGLGICP